MRNKETEKLFKLAYTDAMTGVYNRNAYEEKLEKLNKANARLDNIMVVIVDLDKLKCINDTYGHRTGDDAIKTVADCILKTVGKKADIYRIGGDEFVCIAERDISSYIAELRDLVSFVGKEKLYPLSVSLGYSRFDTRKDKTIDDLIKHCDKKLYDAKKRKAVDIEVKPIDAESIEIILPDETETNDNGIPKVNKGSEIQLKAEVLPENTTYKDIEWSVSDETIATIDENGLLTATATGTITITATAKSGVTEEIEIEVYSNAGDTAAGILGLAVIGGGGAAWYYRRKKKKEAEAE